MPGVRLPLRVSTRIRTRLCTSRVRYDSPTGTTLNSLSGDEFVGCDVHLYLREQRARLLDVHVDEAADDIFVALGYLVRCPRAGDLEAVL